MSNVEVINRDNQETVAVIKEFDGLFMIPVGTEIYDSGTYNSDIEILINNGTLVEGKYVRNSKLFKSKENLLKNLVIDTDYSKYEFIYETADTTGSIDEFIGIDGVNKTEGDEAMVNNLIVSRSPSIVDNKEESNTDDADKLSGIDETSDVVDKIDTSDISDVVDKTDISNISDDVEETDRSETGIITNRNESLTDIPLEQLVATLVSRITKLPRTIKFDDEVISRIDSVLSKNSELDISEQSIKKLGDIFNKDTEREEYEWSGASHSYTDKRVIGYDSIIDELNEELKSPKKAVLLEGVPGTGKTLILNKYRDTVDNGHNTEMVSFHQNYSYNEFIGGYTADEHGGFSYSDGIFTRFCQLADHDRDVPYYFFIDEISRGNVEAIFGEIMTALTFRDRLIVLSSGRKFMIPSNVYIVASRNITDKSTKSMDIATLQRFEIIMIEPQWTDEYIDNMVKGNDDKECRDLLKEVCNIMLRINKSIKEDADLGEQYQIGTRTLDINDISIESIKRKIKYDLIPSIQENTKGSFGIMEEIQDYIDDLYRKVFT